MGSRRHVSPGKLFGAVEASGDEGFAEGFFALDAEDFFGDVARVFRVEEEGVFFAADFGDGGCVGRGDGCAALHGFERREAEAFIEGGEDVNLRGGIEVDELFFVDHTGENGVAGEVEGGGGAKNIVGVEGVVAAGDDKLAFKVVFVFEYLEGFEEVGEVFVTAPDSSVKEVWLVDFVLSEGRFGVFRWVKFGVYSFIDHFDFFGIGGVKFLEVFFCIPRNGNDFFGFLDSVTEDGVVGFAVKPVVHFFARVVRKGEVVDGDDKGFIV